VGGVVPLTRLRSWAAAAALLALGCAQNIVQDRTAASSEALAVSKVAVVPFAAAPRAGAGALRPDAAPLVAGYVAESLGTRGIEAVPPSDVEQAFGEGVPAGLGAVPLMRDRFGADAVVVGSVHRFRERDGQALGALHPASVGFEVKLYSADGKLYASKIFDHTQVALGENALTAAQYPGGGSRWLTAEELARWGATEIVKSLPLMPR
jgi:hypothetical protein